VNGVDFGTDFGKVAVLMGGNSAERDISLQSGGDALAALRRTGLDAHGIDARGDYLCRLPEQRFSRAFIALHGCPGEDGTVQGGLETLGLPYTGSGVLACALAMDKSLCKRVWSSHGLPTPEFAEAEDYAGLEAAAERLGLPLAIKPARGGSSLGIGKVTQRQELYPAWQAARRHDNRVLAERWLAGGEYTVPILHGAALPAIRLETPRPFYDYVAKYESEDTRYLCPCGLGTERERQLAELALRGFRALGAEGWGRMDLLLDRDDKPFLLELNTVPGLTDHSLVPMSARHRGLSFDALVVEILKTSLYRGAAADSAGARQ